MSKRRILNSIARSLRANHYHVETTLRKAYKNCLYWCDDADPPGPDAPEVERLAYSQREHLSTVMDELELDYGDLTADPTTSVEPSPLQSIPESETEPIDGDDLTR